MFFLPHPVVVVYFQVREDFSNISDEIFHQVVEEINGQQSAILEYVAAAEWHITCTLYNIYLFIYCIVYTLVESFTVTADILSAWF